MRDMGGGGVPRPGLGVRGIRRAPPFRVCVPPRFFWGDPLRATRPRRL